MVCRGTSKQFLGNNQKSSIFALAQWFSTFLAHNPQNNIGRDAWPPFSPEVLLRETLTVHVYAPDHNIIITIFFFFFFLISSGDPPKASRNP